MAIKWSVGFANGQALCIRSTMHSRAANTSNREQKGRSSSRPAFILQLFYFTLCSATLQSPSVDLDLQYDLYNSRALSWRRNAAPVTKGYRRSPSRNVLNALRRNIAPKHAKKLIGKPIRRPAVKTNSLQTPPLDYPLQKGIRSRSFKMIMCIMEEISTLRP